jgi:hypothetical protein
MWITNYSNKKRESTALMADFRPKIAKTTHIMKE